jgi:ribosomal protein S18 acetylase RimI-like enzyme
MGVAEVGSLLIRYASTADLPAMEWEGEYRRFRRVYEQAFQDARNGRRLILLAELEGQVVGQVIVQLGTSHPAIADGETTGYLHALRVRPGHRNRGVGTALLEEAEKQLRGLGYRQVAIAAAKENPRARKLYERFGFRAIAEDPGEWSFVDDQGRVQSISEPADLLLKGF